MSVANGAGGTEVDGWLSGVADADRESVAGSDVGPTYSEYDALDEDRYFVDESALLSEAGDAPGRFAELDSALGGVAVAAQRMAVSGLHRLYAKGRMYDHPDYSRAQETPQRFFRVERFMTMSSLDDSVLYDALDAGVVITRLGAATGMGKTRRLPGMIASRCGLRVLQLEPDSIIAKTALRVQANEYNIRASSRAWSREKRAYLTTMSYHEFRGVVCSGGRNRLFEDFDVIYMDEAHLPLAVVYCAKQYFATYAKSHNSLIIASATVSTEPGNNTAAHGVGVFEESSEPMSLEDAMESGKLLREHLCDRAMLLVASDEQVALARAYYEQEGIDVSVLDTGSLDGDVTAVIEKFSVSGSAVPRVLVASEYVGTGYNIPVARVITTATVRVYELAADNALVEREIPVMERVVTQHKGRTGRGLVSGSGGWVMSPLRAAEKDLLQSEALEAYLSLVAAGIRPRPGAFDAVTKVLPRGINREVARLLLRCTLPAALTVRYLGSDGRVASRFCKAVELFMQQGEPVLRSRDAMPVGYDAWVTETVGEYYVGDESRVDFELLVPFKSPPGLKIAMHTISAVAQRVLDVPRWVMSVSEDHSDDESVGVRTKVKRGRVALPRVVEDEQLDMSQTVVTSAEPWRYDVDPSGARMRRKRQAMSWEANGDGLGAVKVLLRAIRDGKLGESIAMPQVDAPEFAGKVAYGLPGEAEGEVVIDSPGGGRIVLVAKAIHVKWINGEPLDRSEFVTVLTVLRELKATKRFAMATLFDNWSPAWLSWFSSYTDEGSMEDVKAVGLHKVAIDLLGYLYDRFRAEVQTVVNSSAMYKESLQGFFRKTPSITKFVKAFRKGMVPIAQSDKFVCRVLEIKDAHDVAVMAIENVGLFAPHSVTMAQRPLPLKDKSRNMYVIDASVVDRPPGASVSGKRDRWRE